MAIYPLHRSTCKYGVYLSETFRSIECYSEITEQITRAGILFFSLERSYGFNTSPEKAIQLAMEDADIFALYINGDAESLKPKRGRSIAELEYRCAKDTGKSVLIYLRQDRGFGQRDDQEWLEEVLEQETYSVIKGDNELAFILIPDLLRTILTKSGLSFWIRSNISPAKVDSILQQKTAIDQNLRQASYYIQNYENQLKPEKHDEILGPLIDIGLLPNISGQAYRFAIQQSPEGEIKHEGLKYQYYLNRFEPYGSGAVYDRQLDMTWLIISGQSFTWQGAMEWRKNVEVEIKDKVLEFQPPDIPGKKNEWRLPTIEELITLITEHKQKEDYFDHNLFPGDVHWFWSSTLVKNENKAYYIETTQGTVLKDEFDHLNAILLCCHGKPKKLGELIHVETAPTINQETEILRQANRSRHIYGVYLSILKSDYGDYTDLVNQVVQTLHKGGYSVESNLTRLSRVVRKEENILDALEHNDAYVLVIDRTATPLMLDNARTELRLARSLNLPVLIYHNFQESLPEDWREKLELSKEEITGLEKFKEAQRLAADLVTSLNSCIVTNSSTGWIRRDEFEAISDSIEKINQSRLLQDEAEPYLNAFIEGCRVQGLRKAFESCGLVSVKPLFGEQTWFVSRENPLQSFFPQDESQHDYDLPILFEKIPNRFEPLVDQENHLIIYDHYLKLKWWTRGVKKTTLMEAFDYARNVTLQQEEAWRLPTIEEMATLLTHYRINRKYMDEKAFPLGRWFWTASTAGDLIYYIDYNYLRGSIRREDLSQFTDNFPTLRKKSVILVADDVSTDWPFERSQKTQPRLNRAKKGDKPMDPSAVPLLTSTLNFLFGEVSKILEERRETRKEKREAEEKAGLKPVEASQFSGQIAPVPTTKEELFRMPANELVLKEKEEDIKHVTTMLHTYIRNYRLAKEQLAMWGTLAPPIKIHELEEAEAGIAQYTQKLEKLLSKVYGKEIVVEDLRE